MKKLFFIGLIILIIQGCSTTSTPLTSTPKQTAFANIPSTQTLSPVPLTHTSTPILTPSSTNTATPDPYNGPVKIYGYVKDENGYPVVVPVTFESSDSGDQGFVKTDSNGYYEKQLSASVQYIVSAEPGPEKQINNYSFPSGYIPQRKLVIRNGPETRVDFVLHDSGILWLKAYSPSGLEMASQDFLDSSKVGVYPIGNFPYGETIQAKYASFPLFWGWIKNSNKNIPCLMLPPAEPVEIWVVWRLPEVGTTFLHADNDSKGFMVEKGNITPINLVYEFARTEYREASDQFQELQGTGFTFSSDIALLLDNAKQNLTQAENNQKKGMEIASAINSYKVLTQVIKTKEQLVLERAQQDIEKSRKGNVTIYLTDDKGNKLTNARVEYQQVSHDFIFSAGWPNPDQYPILKDDGFEYSFFEGWWGEIETRLGNYLFPDKQIEQLQQAGFGYLMHTGPWLLPYYPPALPQFAATMDPAELSSHLYQYSYDLISHFSGKVKMYDALVEPDLPQSYHFTSAEQVDIARSSIMGAKKADPKLPVYVLVSDPIFGSLLRQGVNYSVVYDQYGKLLPAETAYDPPFHSGYEFVKAVEDAGVDLDTVGLEYYFGAPFPSIDLSLFANSLDFNSTLSKKIFIGEITYPTLEEYPGLIKFWTGYGGWHEGFTDKAQADWIRSTMSIAFSKPYVNGYQYSTTNDGPLDYYLAGTGLFRKDHETPRPALSVIRDLIASWTTRGNAVTDESASVSLRGFGGDYTLTITTTDGHTFHGKVHVTEQQDNQINLVLDTTPPEITSASISPKVIKNGNILEIKANSNEAGSVVTADVSQLDTSKKDPIALNQDSNGMYTTKFSVGIGNTSTNGIKIVTIYAMDSGGNVGKTTIDIELNNPPPLLDIAPPDDNFDSTTLDLTKWNPQINGGGTVKQDSKLILSVNNTPANSVVSVQSKWGFTGDFDAQVDFQIGPGWTEPSHDHLDGATLGVAINGQTYHLTRLRSNNQDLFFSWSNQGTLTETMPATVLSGKYRLVRAGTNLTLLYNIGNGWQDLANVTVPSSPAQVYLANGSVNASQAFTTYFDNFHINSGLTNYSP